MINGLVIFFCGFVLSLPLPIPFTNTIPAIAILLLSMGMMEEDGLFILLGYGVAGCACIYLITLIWLGHLGLGVLPHP